MSELKQLTKEFLEKFSIANFSNISPDDAQGNKDFFADLGKQKAKIEVLLEKALREGNYQAIAEASPLSIFLGHYKDACRMLKNQMEKGEAGIYAKTVDIETLTNVLIETTNTFHHYLVNTNDEKTTYQLLKTYESNRFLVDKLYDADKKGTDVFYFSKNYLKNGECFADLLALFEEHCNGYGFYQLLTRYALNGFEKNSENKEALDKFKERFNYFLDNSIGYKSYIAKKFVLSGPPTRSNTQTDSINVCYRQRITELQAALDGVENFTAKSYITMLELLDEHNKKEAKLIQEQGYTYVNYFGQHHDVMFPKRLIDIRNIKVPVKKGNSFKDCLNDALNNGISIDDAYSIIAHQQGEFEIDGKTISVQQHDGFKSNLHDHAIINTFENDTLLGVKKEVKRCVQDVSYIAMAHPFGGLDETKPVIEQITPHMQKLLTVGFLPTLKDIEKFPSAKELTKFFNATHSKIVAENFKELVDKGLPLKIYEKANDLKEDGISLGGVSPFFFNYANRFSHSVTNPQIVKEFNKIGLNTGFVDALNKFGDILWSSEEGFMQFMSPAAFKKLVNLSLSEVAKGQNNGAKDFLMAAAKIYTHLNVSGHYIDGNKMNLLPISERETFAKSFCSDVYEVLNGVRVKDLVDGSGTSPLIQLINEFNKIKNETTTSTPIFVKDENNEYKMIGHTQRDASHTYQRLLKVEMDMFENFSMTLSALRMPLYGQLNAVKNISSQLSEFLNLAIPRKFFEGENVSTLIKGKDEQGNNILHHLLQNPTLFYSAKDRVNEENLEYERGKERKPEHWHNSRVKFLSEAFMVNGAHVNGLNEEYSNIAHLVDQIPHQELKRLALEKNNAGRTPLEELCYFTEFVKERAQTSFSISKKYNDLLDIIMDINGIDTSSKLEVLRKPPEFLRNGVKKDKNNKNVEVSDTVDTSYLVADTVQERFGNILRYLYSLDSFSERYDFQTALSTSTITTPSLEYKIMKGDGAVKKAMSKLPL